MLLDDLFAPRPAGRVAVLAPDGPVTYAALHARAAELARRLSGGRSPVLLYGHKQPDMLAGMLAAVRVGRPYVPVDSALPPARVARIVELAGPGDAVEAEALPPAAAAALERVRPGADSAERSLADPPLAYILFTSGTTGDPKGVRIPRRALAAFAGWLIATQRFASGPEGSEVFLNQAPLHFDLSVMDVYSALLTGGTLLPILREEVADPRRLFARLHGAPLTVWVSTPSFARFCLAEPGFGAAMLPALRRFLFCGEALPPAVAVALLDRFPGAEVWNTYGPTETTVAVTHVRITRTMAERGEPLPVGRPAPGAAVWVADPCDPVRPLPPGAVGEIVVAGRQVGLGYLGAAAGGFVTLPDGRAAYRTGDAGHAAADGLLYCHGRLDRQIKLHGYRLELEEIEACLRDVRGVGEAAVVAVERGGRPDHLVAFVVPAGAGLPASESDLTRHVRAALAERLPAYALPRAVRPLASAPLTANGKLDRGVLQGLLHP